MKSANAIRRYLDHGYTIVGRPPEGAYLYDGKGTYQIITEEAASEALDMGEVQSSHPFCVGCLSEECSGCVDWYYEEG